MRLRQRQPPGRWKQLLLRSGEPAWSGTPTHQSSVLQFKGLPVLGEASLEYGVDGFSLIRRALFCQLLPADVSECHGGPERGASAGIAAAEDGSGVVADGEQAGDRLLSTSRAGFSWPSRLFSGRPFGKGRKGPTDGYRVFWLWSHFLTGEWVNKPLTAVRAADAAD